MGDPSQSKINQFKRLFGFGAKPSVKQPTPPLAQELKQTDIPVQSPDLSVSSSATDTTPPVADATVPGLIDKALANLETTSVPPTNNLAPEQAQPAVEALAQPEPEQTPAEKLKQKIAASVDAFLEEVIKEKVVA